MRRVKPITPLEMQQNQFVAGRSREPVATQVVNIAEEQSADAWHSILTSSLNNPHARAKPRQSKRPARTPSHSLFSNSSLAQAQPSFSPILVPQPEQIRSEFSTSWNASSFRRAVAASCYRWRTKAASMSLTRSNIRDCFCLQEDSLSVWNDLLLMLFDLWNHVEIACAAQRKLSANLFLQIELATKEGEALLLGTGCEDASVLLTSIKAFLSEFETKSESDWKQERIVKYWDRAKTGLVTTYLSSDGARHVRETTEETLECVGPSRQGFLLSVASRDQVDASELPLMSVPEQVEISQYKVFTWEDSSFAHTLQISKKPIWKLALRMSWRGATMLEADAQLAARRLPRVTLAIESDCIDRSVQSSIAGEMALMSCAGIYSIAAIAMTPRERDEWRWKLAQ